MPMAIDRSQLESDLIQFILQELATPGQLDSLAVDGDLLESSLIDSLGIMRLIAFIDQRTGYTVPAEDIVIENFLSVSAITDYLLPKIGNNES